MNTERCEHESRCKDWLNIPSGVIKAHPVCVKCGAVKNVSSDRGKKVSHFVTAFYRMKKELERRGYKVSDVQMRLVFKELPEDFGDTWSITYSAQKELYLKAVTKYVRVSRDFAESFL